MGKTAPVLNRRTAWLPFAMAAIGGLVVSALGAPPREIVAASLGGLVGMTIFLVVAPHVGLGAPDATRSPDARGTLRQAQLLALLGVGFLAVHVARGDHPLQALPAILVIGMAIMRWRSARHHAA